MVKNVQNDLWGKTRRPLEAEVMREIKQFLDAKRIFFFRQNSGAYKDGERYIKFGAAGVSDFVALFPGDTNGNGAGRFWYIESKRPGGRLSDSQLEFIRLARVHGAVITIAESSYDLETQLKDWRAPCSERYEKAINLWSTRKT